MPFRSPAQRGTTPQGRGRFPGFDVLDNVEEWDDVTAGVVLARLTLPGELAFFRPHEVGIASALLDLIFPGGRSRSAAALNVSTGTGEHP